MSVGTRLITPVKASNSKRQKQRRNKALRELEQGSVAANVIGTIEKALGYSEYQDRILSNFHCEIQLGQKDRIQPI